jgi:hypothetical protein
MQATAVTLCELNRVWQGFYPLVGRLAPKPKPESCAAQIHNRELFRPGEGAACDGCGGKPQFRPVRLVLSIRS